MTLWFTADTHFGHGNIIKYCDRPFTDAGQMDAELIANWNALVKPNDEIHHLGDVAFHTDPAKYLQRLNGKKFVYFGNHDKKKLIRRCEASGIIEWCGDVNEIKWEGHRFFLSHYAHRFWPGSHRGGFHCFGHSHGASDYFRSVDVGVDVEMANYFPISAERVIRRLERSDVLDHHPEMSASLV